MAFGWGKRTELGRLAAGLGRRALLLGGLREAGIGVEAVATAHREPTIEDVDEAAQAVRDMSPRPGDFVLGIGGGSAMDLAKAVAALATNAPGGVRDYLEGIGTGKTLSVDPLPLLAVPTTAGTGSEATRNAVISCSDPPCKKSLRSDKLIPAAVLIDPELTVSCPQEQTAWCGMDAITQLIESYVSKKSTPATDLLCLGSLRRAVDAIVTAVEQPADRGAREALSFAAFCSGIALANSGLGMAHGVAAALGAVCDVPHGLACAVLLPIAMRTNHFAAREKLNTLGRTLAPPERLPMLEGNAAADAVIAQIEDLFEPLKIPSKLRDLGVRQEQIPELVVGSRGSSMNGNPREISEHELTQILEANW